MSGFTSFAHYHTREEADAVADILKKEGIPYKVEHERNLLDKIYVGESLDPFYSVNIPPNFFEQANGVLLEQAKSQLEGINPDYYLFSFTNEELLEVKNNPGEWNHFDQALADKLLAERKVSTPAAAITAPVVKSKYPLQLEIQWIVMGYVISILFTIGGILAGLITLNAGKTLPDGTKVPLYNKNTHQHATIILIIGIIRTVATFSLGWFLLA